MLIVALMTIGAAGALAYANGSNDVSKGVATLVGSGRASYPRALAWGTLWTGVGAAAALVISIGLVKAFTSSMVDQTVLASPVFPLAAAAGAAAWVLFASRTGLPVSTTHALAGAIVGAAIAMGGPSAVRWWLVLLGIAAPLAFSPLASGIIGYGAYALSSRWSRACVCVQETAVFRDVDGSGAATAGSARQIVASACGCDAGSADTRRIIGAGTLHWGASAALSFARGANDTPKIAAVAALGLSAIGVTLSVAFLITGMAMVAGSLLSGFRVTRTLGERVVEMDRDTGLASAVVAAGLVLSASLYAMPVSTTHVSTGAIVGAGLRQGTGAVHWGSVRGLVLAWVVTLPVAAGLGACVALGARGWL